MQILHCLYSQKSFVSIQSCWGSITWRRFRTRAQWSSSCALAHGAFSHHSMLYNLWSSLDPQAPPWPTEMPAVLCSITAQQQAKQATPPWLLEWGNGVLMNMRTQPKTVVLILHYHTSTDISSFWVVWQGMCSKITVSPCYPCTDSWADSSGAVVWAVGSNKWPWWVCPSLGILCHYGESGGSVARVGQRCGRAARGQGLVSDRGFLTGARLLWPQLLQSLPSSHTRRRRAKA